MATTAAVLTQSGAPYDLPPASPNDVNAPSGATYGRYGYALLAGKQVVTLNTWDNNGSEDLYVSVYDPSGALSYSQILASITSSSQPGVTFTSPTIFSLSNGDFVVTWDRHSVSGAGSDTSWFEELTPAGAVVASGHPDPAQYSLNMSGVALANGGFQLNWTSASTAGGAQTAQTVSFTGQGAPSSTTPVATPYAYALGSGGAYLELRDNQALYFNGAQYAPAVVLPGEAAHQVTSETAATLSGGAMAVIWTDAQGAHEAVFNPATDTFSTPTTLGGGPAGDAHIVALPDGGFAVSWAAGGTQHGETFDSSGNLGPPISLTGEVAGVNGSGQLFTIGATAAGGYAVQAYAIAHYENYLGRPMPESASPPDDPAHSLHGPNQGGATLYAPSQAPAGVAANGGNNTIIASNGDNSYWLGPTDTVVVPGGLTGTKTIYAWNAEVLPAGVNNLVFYGAGNWGIGNAGDNLIVMGGNDVNYMDGGAGNDVMVGGYAKNTFGVTAGQGSDVIYNFHTWQDMVRMPGASFTSFAQVQAAMTQVGSDVVLQIDPTETLTFRGVALADFQAKNFLLPLDSSQLGALTFDDEFNTLQLLNTNDGSGQWRTHFNGPTTSVDTYSITANQEKQVYTDASFQGTAGHPLGYDPFSIDSGVLGITAQRLSYADSQYAFGQAFSSGMLNTQGLFAQQYGYFEMKAQLPTALGTWPAFWLAQDPFVPGTEADVLEHLAMYPNVAFSRTNDNGYVQGGAYYMPDPTGFHTYGMLWTPTTTTFYVDGLAVTQLATPASWNKPMYMILNLAVGGWGGPIDDSGLPAQMNVDYVRVYGLADNAQVVNNMTAQNGYVSIGAASYVAPANVSTINLVGSSQTITGNNAGDTFISNNTLNHLIGGAGADTFYLGRGGDLVTGGAGADTFIYKELPWSGGHITDFNPGQDTIDLTALITGAGYAGSDPVGAGYVRIDASGAGDAQVWVNPAPSGANSAWWLATTLDGVAPSQLAVRGDVISGTPSAPPAGGAVSTGAASYTAPSGVTSITLTGSNQTVTGNNAGDTFTSNNTGNHLIGGTGADTFVIGRAGDVVTGGAGADAFVFNETPWSGAHITDFSGSDRIDLTGLLARSGYTGAHPVADGYIKITADASGAAQVWSDLDAISPGAGWWLVATLDGAPSTGVQVQGDMVVAAGAPSSGTGSGGSGSTGAAVSTSAASYTAPAGVTSITLTGSAQTVTGNNAGDTFTSNNTGNQLIGGTGADTFVIGRAGDLVTGGAGADTFKFSETPWAGGHITDFSGQDSIDLTGLLARSGYSGSNAISDGYIKITDATAGAQIWSNLDPASPGAGWWLVTTLDGVSSTGVQMSGGHVGLAASAGQPAADPSVSTSAASYTAPPGVTSITLTGSGQTVTGNNAGDTFTSNNTGNHLIGGSGADTFVIGRAGDVVTGGAGPDSFVFKETPWSGARITDFAAGQDGIDLTGLLARSGYAGSDPIADGYVKITADASGAAQVWSDLDHVSPGAGWWLVATLDGVATSSLHMHGAFITG